MLSPNGTARSFDTNSARREGLKVEAEVDWVEKVSNGQLWEKLSCLLPEREGWIFGSRYSGKRSPLTLASSRRFQGGGTAEEYGT
jgi:hypothetical protein